jgi:hypothetical protein
MRRFATLLIGLFILASWQKANSAEFVFDQRVAPTVEGSVDLYLIGDITVGDYDRFVSAMRIRGAKPFSLTLRSGGGNVLEAMKIGRLVRELSISVWAPTSSMETPSRASCGYDLQAVGRRVPCICASACTLVFFGSVFRSGFEVYIHSIKYDDNSLGGLSPLEAGDNISKA